MRRLSSRGRLTTTTAEPVGARADDGRTDGSLLSDGAQHVDGAPSAVRRFARIARSLRAVAIEEEDEMEGGEERRIVGAAILDSRGGLQQLEPQRQPSRGPTDEGGGNSLGGCGARPSVRPSVRVRGLTLPTRLPTAL